MLPGLKQVISAEKPGYLPEGLDLNSTCNGPEEWECMQSDVIMIILEGSCTFSITISTRGLT